MDKNETKDLVEGLIEIRDETEFLIRDVVFDYAKTEKLLSPEDGIDTFPYKKIIRTEFGLVI